MGTIFTVVVLILIIKWIEWYTRGTPTHYYYTKNGERRRGKV